MEGKYERPILQFHFERQRRNFGSDLPNSRMGVFLATTALSVNKFNSWNRFPRCFDVPDTSFTYSEL